MLYQEITECRICKSTTFTSVVNLGMQALTGVFPKPGEEIPEGPLELVKCAGACGLVQLKHNYDLSVLYGDNYGYRSGLNQSMVRHLQGIVKEIQGTVTLNPKDLMVDIASNDSTLLQAYPHELTLVGIDPTSAKFKSYYPAHITAIPEFFSASLVKDRFKQKAKVVTSIAMFYDLEHPIDFMKDIYDILAEDGVWVFEQSYMPLMIQNVSYDTICHEHLEYYALKQIKWMTDTVGFKIVGVAFTDANGGSFRITVAKKDAPYEEATEKVRAILATEESGGFNGGEVYDLFQKNMVAHRAELLQMLADLHAQGKKVFGYGASTKGNVILQYCGLTSQQLPAIAEVNEFKFGRQTPGTKIPIMSEAEVKALGANYLLVLPWHFKQNILEREAEYLENGGHLIFPLPKLEII